METTYEDTDDEGNPLTPRGGGRPRWQTEPVGHRDVLDTIFKVYNRKYFGDAREQRAWKKIAKAIDKGMSHVWIANCLAWAKSRIDTGGFIPFYSLENLILNAVKEREFMAKNKMFQREADGDIVFNPGGDGEIVGG